MRAPMIRPRIAFAAVMAWAAATAAPPRAARAADPLPQRATGLVVKNGQLQISVGLQDLFGPAERQHLTSGFSTRILLRVALQDAGDAEGEPLALAVQRAEIVYDIWDEKFSVRVTRGLGAELRAIAPTAEEAIWRATALWQFPIAETKRLRPGGHYMGRFTGGIRWVEAAQAGNVHTRIAGVTTHLTHEITDGTVDDHIRPQALHRAPSLGVVEPVDYDARHSRKSELGRECHQVAGGLDVNRVGAHHQSGSCKERLRNDRLAVPYIRWTNQHAGAEIF